MQIVIDIPRKCYEDFKLQLPILNKKAPSDFAKYTIATGTPLPEGHGRLIDEKDLSLMTIHMIDGMLVCDAPTIIEADKE